MSHERITLGDSALSAMGKMAEGNPGAAAALAELYMRAPEIDPDMAFGNWAPLLNLDRMGIYGARIWLLWKDVCEMDPVKVLTLLRAAQLGIITDSNIVAAVADRPSVATFDFAGLLADVRKQLPKFAIESAAGRSPASPCKEKT